MEEVLKRTTQVVDRYPMMPSPTAAALVLASVLHDLREDLKKANQEQLNAVKQKIEGLGHL